MKFRVSLLVFTALAFHASVLAAPKGMVLITDLDKTIQVQMAYSNHRNFTGQKFYQKNKCYLLPQTAKALITAQKKALSFNLSLLLLDCYRPHPISRKMWQFGEQRNANCRKKFGPNCKQKNCDPKNPDCAWVPLRDYLSRLSNHSRGTAVDVTLVELAPNGLALSQLNMGTPYDSFSPLSRTRAATGQAQQNRQLLKRIMESVGFKNYFREWWHFDFGPKNASPVISDAVH